MFGLTGPQDNQTRGATYVGKYTVRENLTGSEYREAYAYNQYDAKGDPAIRNDYFLLDTGLEINISGVLGAGNYSVVSGVSVSHGRDLGEGVTLSLAAIGVPTNVRSLVVTKEGPDPVTYRFSPDPLDVMTIHLEGSREVGSDDRLTNTSGHLITTGADSKVSIHWEL